ncbi:TlpA family protein disulfide reductase [Hymenobacter rubripertinctus]|uniref:TlpA family protein disulfide reductase n=1 Tax=Hymenobacter rubripertinctus TaxID=2029981 RepID=A0A418QSL0_9BACT|nr:TlpA disulfide reductase family protein [Hymenobacter rubripertinctus]RIY08259.1 TlpA family protein disulfide reductase [Hymenobacter rubripertinctus]
MPVAFSFRKAIAGAGLALAAVACQSNSTTSETTAAPDAAASGLSAGTWRGVLSTQGQEIPFLFDVATAGGSPTVTLRNGEERLKLDEITTAGDSTTIRLGVFDAALVVRADGTDKLQGAWVKYDAGKPYRVPFAAEKGAQPLFPVMADQKALSFDGTWKVTFKDEEGKTYPAVGVFTQTPAGITGTFLTSTGDYRYLSGQVDGNTMKLSTFDGSHGFLFTGNKLSDTNSDTITLINGDFYSGLSGHETWTATLDPTAKLPDANALTGMKPGQKKLDFKFPSIAGGTLSPTDAKYQGKVVVVQMLGSWCPNCMDETNFLAPWYEQNKQRGVEIIGLGYERASDDEATAKRKLTKMKQRLNVGYDLALAGVADKDAAGKTLPQIQKVLAFPTTIFLDKKGEVRTIHTGFSGPGTGKYYEQEKADFNKTIDQLLAE